MRLQSFSAPLLIGVLSAPLTTCAWSGDRVHDAPGRRWVLQGEGGDEAHAGLAQGSVVTAAARLVADSRAEIEREARRPHSADASACPDGMTLVEGEYCPEVEQECLRWLDPPGKYHHFRCAEYAKPAKCLGRRRVMRFCIDRDETREGGDPRPQHHVSYASARDACLARGARLCNLSEWQFACEGEEMRPYPYGFVRDSDACNVDRFDLGTGPGSGLYDFREATGARRKCASPFGVRDLAGNVEEWVTKDRDVTMYTKSTLLKGSWWLPGKSTCRATNAGHDEVYQGPETGFRCCR